MKKSKIIKRISVFILALGLVLQILPAVSPLEVAAASADSGSVNTTPFPIDYDPNEGLIHYGFYGDMDDIGMRVENDWNNANIEQKDIVVFPDDLIGLKDENGADMFPGYDPSNAYYDYTDMLNHALEIARAKGNLRVHVNPGVYYFTGSIPLHGYTPIDGEAGKTAFVVKPNFIDRYGQECGEYGFFTIDNVKERYSWYFSSVSDLTIVVEGTHPSFKPTSTYEEIYANILSDDIQATDKYSLFYHIRIGYGGIYNNAAAGFYSYFRSSFVDMLTKVQNNTFGPCRDVIYGCDTNDAMFANNIFYGGYFTDEEGLQRMPTFMTTFNTGTTTFTNSYISNFHLARTGAGCWAPHASYSNVTFEKVLNICVDTTAKANIAMSGCHLLNCTRTDVERYFESLGYVEHDPHWENGKWTTDGNGYMIFQSLTKYNKRNDYEKEQEAHMFRAGSMSISQCLIECDSLENTILFHMDDSEWESKYANERKASKCLTFTDNAFKIRDWKYENLLKIDWRDESVFTEETLKNGFKDYTWIENYKPVEKDVPIAWTEGMKLISTELEWYLDFGAFAFPNVPTNGYRVRGITQIGADEDALREAMRDRYYNDLKSGREVVYASDFGAINYDHSDNKNALQTAFDYAATHDAILYIEPGTYYVQDSIVLRGGKTYRIVCDGEIVVNGNSYIANEGLFVMDKDDNAPINGYYIGVYISVHGSDGSAFYNVNMKDMYLKIRSVQRGQSAFHNCHLEDCYITDGQMQFSQYGWFWNSTVKNTLITNVYGTGSTGYEGEDGITPGDISYQFLISSSDLINTTMRANWLEFLQFSNGKKITGEGNSLYRGNLIDYSYNYSFGRNDVVVGNTLSRGGYPAIVDHMLHSNFPIDLPDALTDYMVLFHVSDGLQLIGNADVATLNAKTHFVEFDSPTIKYKDASGNTVSSISNARVAGNLTRAERKTGNVAGTVDYGIGDDVVLENCLNNQLELQMFWQGDTKPDTDKVDENEVWKKSIPGVEACVNGERISVTVEALKDKNLTDTTTPQNLTPEVKNLPPQDKDYDVENVWEQNISTTTYELMDFRERTDEELAILKQQTAGLIVPDTIQIYRGMEYDYAPSDNIYNKADLNPNDGVDKKEGFREQDITPENRAYIYSQCVQYDIRENVIGKDAFYMYQKDIEDVRKRHEDAPTYAIVLSEQKGDILQGVKAGIYQEMGLGESYMRKPAIIYAEDANYYYGILVAYDCTLTNSNNRGIYIYPGTLKKNPATGKEGRFADAGNTGWIWGDRHQLSMQDLGSLESYYGRVRGDYTEQLMFGGDPSKHASDILGVEFELNYEDAYELVNITAVFDFTGIGTDEAGQKATLRRVNLGSFSVKDLDKVFGLWGGDETWVNYVQAEVVGATPCTDGEHTFKDVTIREATCTYKGEVRHECTKCDYEYLSEIKAKKHDFTVTQGPLEEGEKGFYADMTFVCRNCDFTYVEKQLIIAHLCNHKVKEVIQEQKETCETAGFKVYKCKATDCGEEWSETIEALGHNYVATVVQPTATDQGYTLHVCSRCQNSYQDNFVEPGAPTETPKPTQPPQGEEEPVVSFVTRMYEQCLSRTPDQAGLDGWVSQLEKGYMTGADIAKQFIFGQEMIDKNLSDAAFVELLYKSLLGREADESGKAGWVSQLQKGNMTRMEETKAFAESTEFTQICEDYGITRGTYDASDAKLERFVLRFYNLCLERSADQPGLYGWVSNLKKDYMDGARMADVFFFGKEFIDKSTTNQKYIELLYTTILGRKPDSSETAGWISQLQKGNMTRMEIMKSFIESVEFTDICNTYGITRGTYDASDAKLERFVLRFYSLCLERSADQPGLYGWVSNLKNKYMNGAQMADAFFFSEEFLDKSVSNEKYVELLYKTILGRDPAASETAGWIYQLENEFMSRRDIMEAFIESKEFTDICNTYGIVRGNL